MQAKIILTVISEDKPGVVEAIANTVANCQGNWLESSLAQLSGKFAGVITVALPEENSKTLSEQLDQLKAQNINISIDRLEQTQQQDTEGKSASFSVAGPDRKGIVKEISQALAGHKINLLSLETTLSSMPYSGEPLFEAKGNIAIPEGLDLQEVGEKMYDIADMLGVDISLSEDAT